MVAGQIHAQRLNLRPVLHWGLHAFGKSGLGGVPADRAADNRVAVLGDENTQRGQVMHLTAFEAGCPGQRQRLSAGGALRGAMFEHLVGGLAPTQGGTGMALLCARTFAAFLTQALGSRFGQPVA